MATNGGEIESAFDNLRDCWLEKSLNGTIPWQVRLPVIDCVSNNVGTCEKLVGVVEVWILWITGKGEDPGYNEAPLQMGAIPADEDPGSTFEGLPSWPSPGEVLPTGQDRWNSFVGHYTLQNITDAGTEPAPYVKKSIYFLPVCKFTQPAGLTGGVNFGILAEIPVLVK
jgi:hypothetical protein